MNSNQLHDLRTTRVLKGLTLEDVSSGMLRIATLTEIECGIRVPRKSTMRKIESIVGPVDWKVTLSGRDRQHIVQALEDFINLDGPGDAKTRIKFLKQSLDLLEKTI